MPYKRSSGPTPPATIQDVGVDHGGGNIGVAKQPLGGPAQGKKRVLALPGPEFIRRFLMHVLPPGFKRILHYGPLAASHKAGRLAAARAALDVPPPDPVVIESVADFLRRVEAMAWRCCPACGAEAMVVTAIIARPPRCHNERAPP